MHFLAPSLRAFCSLWYISALKMPISKTFCSGIFAVVIQTKRRPVSQFVNCLSLFLATSYFSTVRTSSFVTWSLYEMCSILQEHLISMACILLWSSAVRVHDSQAYRKMDVTRERINRILELREILLSLQTGFSFVNAAVVCAILESISGLEPSSVITEPRHLKLLTV